MNIIQMVLFYASKIVSIGMVIDSCLYNKVIFYTYCAHKFCRFIYWKELKEHCTFINLLLS